MEERGISANLLANLINVTPITVERWLNGKFEPRHKYFVRIVDALDVSADFLAGKSDNMNR